ncbi:hypothetical protein JY651_27905 [Pyxidicoccus parkwayensis]|uniref:Small multi-drug export protein n=1 Tax=Pyxidicoccus parkwayensis TaxID=2813578 RepID=A0ABX7NJZ9_9BACT|nr:hypothetical protein [Pyxidicoccus parkwaysis]QSQ19169.1 hypothetical protein JY651_27905 [Pyxidicoccus parkwaysis]
MLSFALVAASPLGGIFAAVPLGVLGFGYPAWGVAAACVPLGYAQVVVVDLTWDGLERWDWWRRLLRRPRSELVQRLLSSCGGFWSTAVLVPLIGPWAVMGLMRVAGVPQRRVAMPILFALAVLSAGLSLVCVVAPQALR